MTFLESRPEKVASPNFRYYLGEGGWNLQIVFAGGDEVDMLGTF